LNEEYQKILETAVMLFMRFGIKSVSMDDLARELGMSKKTIYKHFSDKKDLVASALDKALDLDRQACIRAYEGDSNAIQKMINLSRYVSEMHSDMNPAVLYDITKYYPKLWVKFESFRGNFIKETILENIEEGQKDGYYRENLKPDIISLLYITLIKGMMSQLSESSNPYDFGTLHKHMVSYHLNGICTTKGKQYLENHFNEIQ
jgi:AcrR family transcriptional regulator